MSTHSSRRHALPSPVSSHWVVVGVLCLITLMAVVRADRRADDAVAAWGPSREVLIATVSLEPRQPLEQQDLRVERMPDHLVPEDALTVDERPEAVTRTVGAGVVLTAHDTGRAVDIPTGQRAIELPADDSAAAVEPGDRIELAVVGSIDPWGDQPATVRLIPATVIAVHPRSWTVAVPRDDAASVVQSMTTGRVVPVLAP